MRLVAVRDGGYFCGKTKLMMTREEILAIDPTDYEVYRAAMRDVNEGRVYTYSSLEEELKVRIANAEI